MTTETKEMTKEEIENLSKYATFFQLMKEFDRVSKNHITHLTDHGNTNDCGPMMILGMVRRMIKFTYEYVRLEHEAIFEPMIEWKRDSALQTQRDLGTALLKECGLTELDNCADEHDTLADKVVKSLRVNIYIDEEDKYDTPSDQMIELLMVDLMDIRVEPVNGHFETQLDYVIDEMLYMVNTFRWVRAQENACSLLQKHDLLSIYISDE